MEDATGAAGRVLHKRQTDIEKQDDLIRRLEADCEAAAKAVRGKQLVIETLEEQVAKNTAKLNQANEVQDETKLLEEYVREVEAKTHKHRDHIEKLDQQLEALEIEMESSKQIIQELEIQTSSRTELKIIFGEAWQVSIQNYRLRGPAPLDRAFNSLICFGGQMLIKYGGTPWDLGNDLSLLNLDTKSWEDPSAGVNAALVGGIPGEGEEHAGARPRCGHVAVAIRPTQMLVLGGKEPVENDGGHGGGGSYNADGSFVPGIALLDYDNARWEYPTTRGVPPPPRAGHCAVADKDSHLFMFGGRTLQDDGVSTELSNDMWCLTYAGATETWAWQLVSTSGTRPTPRWGASMCVTDNGTRLYVYGGHDDTQSLGDVFWLDVHRGVWTNMGPGMGTPPKTRHGHTASILGSYMIINGGNHQPTPGTVDYVGARRCTDTWLMDLSNGQWEKLQEWPPNPRLLGASTYSTIYGNRIYSIKPGPDKPSRMLDLEIVELSRPEAKEGLKRNRNETEIVQRLEIGEPTEVTTHAFTVSWRPPSKNMDRISMFKLKLASPTGVVKEVYKGTGMTFKCSGLRANSEHILCVKAEYDDGTFVWSEPVSVSTRAY